MQGLPVPWPAQSNSLAKSGKKQTNKKVNLQCHSDVSVSQASLFPSLSASPSVLLYLLSIYPSSSTLALLLSVSVSPISLSCLSVSLFFCIRFNLPLVISPLSVPFHFFVSLHPLPVSPYLSSVFVALLWVMHLQPVFLSPSLFIFY